MNRSWTSHAARLLCAALLLAGCAPSSEQSVKIAVAVPLRGTLGPAGRGVARAVTLAVEQANASKRFPYKVEAVAYDDQADPQEALNVATRLLADGSVLGVVGHYSSGCSLPAAAAYARGPLAMVTPSATHPAVTAQQLEPDWSGPRVAFRVVPTDDLQGSAAAEFVSRKLGKTRMAVFHDGTPYGQGLAAEFAKSFAARGGKVSGGRPLYMNEQDGPALLELAASAGAQGVYFGGNALTAGHTLARLREQKLNLAFVSGDGAKSAALFESGGEAVDGAYLTMVGAPVESLPGAKDFVAAYGKRWTGPDESLQTFDHMAYEAAQVLLDALERAGAAAGGKPDRAGVLESLRQTKRQGLAGATSFDEKGDTKNKLITVTRARAKDRSFSIVR